VHSWEQFDKSTPELARFGFVRLHGQVAYLATVRRDGQPRLHPVTPLIGHGHLYLFMEPTSPKGHDLQRGSGYCLHSAVADTTGSNGEFQVSGSARLIEDEEIRERVSDLSPYKPEDETILFELSVDRALSTVYTHTGAERKHWRAHR